MTDQQEYEAEAELAAITSQRPVTAAARYVFPYFKGLMANISRKMEREQSRYRMMLHRPGTIHWDEADDRFLVCEAVSHTTEMVENMVMCFLTSK